MRRQMQQLPSLDVTDPNYRRLRYCRYADDALFGFVGTRQEAEAIKRQLGAFLQETLKLTLSEEKLISWSSVMQKSYWHTTENSEAWRTITAELTASRGQ